MVMNRGGVGKGAGAEKKGGQGYHLCVLVSQILVLAFFLSLQLAMGSIQRQGLPRRKSESKCCKIDSDLCPEKTAYLLQVECLARAPSPNGFRLSGHSVYCYISRLLAKVID